MTTLAASASTTLRVAGVRKSFHRGLPGHRRIVEVLWGVDLEVHAGELIGLVGENGSGKTTLMQIVVGLLPRDAGELSSHWPPCGRWSSLPRSSQCSVTS